SLNLVLIVAPPCGGGVSPTAYHPRFCPAIRQRRIVVFYRQGRADVPMLACGIASVGMLAKDAERFRSGAEGDGESSGAPEPAAADVRFVSERTHRSNDGTERRRQPRASALATGVARPRSLQ